MEYTNKVRFISWFIIAAIVIGVVSWYLFMPVIVTDPNDYYELSISRKFTFTEKNVDEKDTWELLMHEEDKDIFLYGYVFKKEEKAFKEIAIEDKTNYIEKMEAKILTDIEIFKIKNNYESYKYTISFINKNQEREYYSTTYLINTENKDVFYIIELICDIKDKDKYKADFDKITETFKELK